MLFLVHKRVKYKNIYFLQHWTLKQLNSRALYTLWYILVNSKAFLWTIRVVILKSVIIGKSFYVYKFYD